MTQSNMNNGDIAFGVIGTAGTFGLGQINLVLGCTAGVLTIAVMLMRLRKEWRDKDK